MILNDPIRADPNELLKNRFLCKGSGLILTGQTGIGKSSLIMQMALHWMAGKSVFGLTPAKALKILMIQAENDEADLAEMRDGVISGLSFKGALETELSNNLKVCTIDDKTGVGFAKCLGSLLEGLGGTLEIQVNLNVEAEQSQTA